jgi:hypothetical protein
MNLSGRGLGLGVPDLASNARCFIARVFDFGMTGVHEAVQSPPLEVTGKMFDNGRMPFT